MCETAVAEGMHKESTERQRWDVCVYVRACVWFLLENNVTTSVNPVHLKS